MSRRGPSIGVPRQERIAVGGRQQAGEDLEEGRLAAAGRADDRHELAVAYGEIDVLKGHQRVGAAPEALPQMPDRNGVAVQRFSHHFARDPWRVTLFF